jgi:hypothetical protein
VYVFDISSDLNKAPSWREVFFGRRRRAQHGNDLTESRIPAYFKGLCTVDMAMISAVRSDAEGQIFDIDFV